MVVCRMSLPLCDGVSNGLVQRFVPPCIGSANVSSSCNGGQPKPSSIGEGHLPVSGGGDEVETAVHSVVGHQASVHPRLGVQVVLKLVVNVVDDRLPAERGTRQE